MIEKTFNVKATPEVMKRFERFLALLHYNSSWGHSNLFAMPLDGDGPEVFRVSPVLNIPAEVNLIGGAGYNIEIAYDDGYSSVNKDRNSSEYTVVKENEKLMLYKDGELRRTVEEK